MTAEPLRVGEPLAAVLLIDDLQRVLRLEKSRAYVLEAAGEFAIFELLPRLGNRRRYSGKKVQAYLDGAVVEAPAAGASRFFQKGRR